MSNIGPALAGLAGLIAAITGLVVALRKPKDEDPPAAAPATADAYAEVERRIRFLHDTIKELEVALRNCREGRQHLEVLLADSRAELEESRRERMALLERLVDEDELT